MHDPSHDSVEGDVMPQVQAPVPRDHGPRVTAAGVLALELTSCSHSVYQHLLVFSDGSRPFARRWGERREYNGPSLLCGREPVPQVPWGYKDSSHSRLLLST